eukprot:864078-Prymnesium_polylepis.1
MAISQGALESMEAKRKGKKLPKNLSDATDTISIIEFREWLLAPPQDENVKLLAEQHALKKKFAAEEQAMLAAEMDLMRLANDFDMAHSSNAECAARSTRPTQFSDDRRTAQDRLRG